MKKILKYTQAVLGDGLELADNGCAVRMSMRDDSADKNDIAALAHFNDCSADETNYTIETLKEAGGRHLCPDILTNWQAEGSGRWGSSRAALLGAFVYGGARLGGAVFPYAPGVLNSLDAVTIQAQVKYAGAQNGVYGIFQEFRGTAAQAGSRWFFARQNGELLLRMWNKDNAAQYISLVTSGLGLQTGQWYQMTISLKDLGGATRARIYVDDDLVAETDEAYRMASYSEADRGIAPLLGVGGVNYYDVGFRAFTCYCSVDELIIWPDEIEPDGVREGPLVPFVENAKAIVSDAGDTAHSRWQLDTLAYSDESPFDSGAIKMRVTAGADPEPSFSGPLLTLDQVRALGAVRGRYLHAEYTLAGDGETRVELSCGAVDVYSSAIEIADCAVSIAIITAEVQGMKTIFRNDTPSFSFAVKDADGQAVDLTNYDVGFCARESADADDYIFDRECQVDDAVGGLCSVVLSAVDTAAAGHFTAELYLEGKTGTEAEGLEHTASQFQLCIKKDVKHA